MTVAVICLMTAVMIPGVMGAATFVDLGEGTHYAILSGSGITNLGGHTTAITGDIGSSPITAVNMNDVSCPEITGHIYGVDATYTGSNSGGVACYIESAPATGVNTAVADRLSAFNLANLQVDAPITLSTPEIGGLTLAPGLYKTGTAVTITTDVTLDAQGDPNAVWVFQIAQGLTMSTGKKVILTNGTKPENIFWVVTGPTSLGATSVFNGNILAGDGTTTIALLDGAKVNGRLMTGKDVTLLNNRVTIPTDASVHAGPNVTSVSPAVGSIAGGTAVTLTGIGFTGATGVTFSGTPATSFVVVNDNTITAVTPIKVAGPVNVVVTTPVGTGMGVEVYTYAATPAPTFTSITPVSGTTAGSTTVTITGTGFTGATAVTFGNTPATSFVVVDDSTITAVTPAKAVGAFDVVVTTPGGIATGTGAYSYSSGLAAVNLGTADDFVILAKTGISTTGRTAIVGNIGVSPAAATYITGFDLVQDASTAFSKSTYVTGNVYAADYGGSTPAKMTTAITNMETAYTDAAGRTSPDYVGLGSGNIGGMTLAPGLYKWSNSVTIPSDVTLAGGADDVWIFQIAQGLSIDADTQVVLSGGAQAKNIFWQVAGQTTLEPNSVFNGIILDQTAIVLKDGARLNGKALAQSAVTMIGNGINTAPGTAPGTPVAATVTNPMVEQPSDNSYGGTLPEAENFLQLPSGQLAPVIPSSDTRVTGAGILKSNPLIVDFSDMLGVAVSWSTKINDNPSADAQVTTAVLPNADQSTLDAMTSSLHRGGLDINNVAYGMVLLKNGMSSSGPTMVTMTVPQHWVDQNGGNDAIRIVSINGDGTAEVLHTWFDGYDSYSGHPTFKATSTENGLGVSYWLISVKPYVPTSQEAVTPVSGTVAPGTGQLAPTQAAVSTAGKTTTTGLWPVMGVGGALAALALVGIALLVYFRRNKGSD